MAVQKEQTLYVIRGKNLVGKATKGDVHKLFEHIDALEEFLEEYSNEDTFGTEGWRHAIGQE